MSEQDSTQVQTQAMFDARTEMIKLDEERIIRLGMNRPIRAQSQGDFKIYDVVLLRMKLGPSKEEKRRGGFRVVGVISHHLILVRGFRLLKFPKFLARLSEEGPSAIASPIRRHIEPSSSPSGMQSVPIGRQLEPSSSSSGLQAVNEGSNIRGQCGQVLSVGDNGALNDVWGEFQSGQRLRRVAPGFHVMFNDDVVDIPPQ